MLAGAAPEDPQNYLQLIDTVTSETQPSWDRPPPPTTRRPEQTSPVTIQQTSAQLASVAATLAKLHQPADDHDHPTRAEDRGGGASAAEAVLRQGQRRREEHPRQGLRRDEPERER